MANRALLCGMLAVLGLHAVQGVVVPAGLADGLYSIPFDANGTALSEPVPLDHMLVDHAYSSSLLLSASSPSPFPRLRRQRQNDPPALPQSQSRCGGGGAITIADFSTAKANLQTECDAGVTYPQRTAVVFTSGGAVAYFCTYDATNRCWRREVEEAMSRVVQACGRNRGGEIYIPQYAKSYGGDNVGQQICRF